jgi:hypothetical protein
MLDSAVLRNLHRMNTPALRRCAGLPRIDVEHLAQRHWSICLWTSSSCAFDASGPTPMRPDRTAFQRPWSTTAGLLAACSVLPVKRLRGRHRGPILHPGPSRCACAAPPLCYAPHYRAASRRVPSCCPAHVDVLYRRSMIDRQHVASRRHSRAQLSTAMATTDAATRVKRPCYPSIRKESRVHAVHRPDRHSARPADSREHPPRARHPQRICHLPACARLRLQYPASP